MRCPSCHHDNPGDASFCEGCGAKLGVDLPGVKSSVSPGARLRRVDHQLKRRIDDRARLSGSKVAHQLGEPLISATERDRLALALDCFDAAPSDGDYDLRLARTSWSAAALSGQWSDVRISCKIAPRTTDDFARRANQLQLRSASLAERGRHRGCRGPAGRTAHRVSCGPVATRADGGRRMCSGSYSITLRVGRVACDPGEPPSHVNSGC